MRYKIGWAALWLAAAATGLVGCAQTQMWPGAPIATVSDSGSENADMDAASRLEFLRPANEQEKNRLSLARLSERRGQGHLAQQIYTKIADENPRSIVAHHRLGILAARQGKLDQADKHLRAARELAPPTAELLSDIGYCYYLQNRIAEAEKTLTAALKLEPSYAEAANNLAMVLGEQRRFDECLAAFRRAGTEAHAHANLAYIYAQLGEFDQAKTHYSRALSIDPEMRTAASAMLQIAERQRGQSYGQPPASKTPAAPAAENDSADKLVKEFAKPLQTTNLAALHAAASKPSPAATTKTSIAPAADTVANVQHVVPAINADQNNKSAAQATPRSTPPVPIAAPQAAQVAAVVKVQPKKTPLVKAVTPAPVANAPVVLAPTSAKPVDVTTLADGMVSVSDYAGRSLPLPSQSIPTTPVAAQIANHRGQIISYVVPPSRNGNVLPTGSRNPTAASAAVPSPIKSSQAAPSQIAPSRSTIPAGRGVQIPGVQTWPGTAAPTQFYGAAQAMPLRDMPLANVAPASENILQAAFQQRLDAVHTSAGTYLPPSQPAIQRPMPAVNVAR